MSHLHAFVFAIVFDCWFTVASDASLFIGLLGAFWCYLFSCAFLQSNDFEFGGVLWHLAERSRHLNFFFFLFLGFVELKFVLFKEFNLINVLLNLL